MPVPETTLLQVSDLKVHFPVKRGTIISREVGRVRAVDGVSFSVRRGETLGLVGESGCGKSTTGLAILRMLRPTSGQIVLDGTDVTGMSQGRLRPLRRKMQMVYQDPYNSLDPRMNVGDIVAEPMRIHGLLGSHAERRRQAAKLLEMVGLRSTMVDRFPHEFSGGQRQRLGIARALAVSPALVICDEPVSALDVSVQAQVVNLFQDLQQRFGLAYLFIAHDLSVVRHISDRIAVMYLGRIVEIASSTTLYREPLHPYTKALLAAVPIPDPRAERARKWEPIKGEVPSALNPPAGCHFHPRCPHATRFCRETTPALRQTGDGRAVACHLYDPAVEMRDAA